jgi:hypothetical protein
MPTSFAEITLAAAAWVGIAAAAVLVATLAVTLVRRRLVAALTLIALLGIAAWAVQISTNFTRDGERRALESRLLALESVTWTPSSPLSCLGAAADKTLETACEHALFASPEIVAAATSLTSARVAWLQDARPFLQGRPSLEAAARDIRAAIEQDRYGFAAHALKQRYGCTAEACAMLSLLRDGAQVRANLRDDTFAKKIASHSVAWHAAPPSEPAPSVAAASGPKYAPLPSSFMLPSPDSIPPISIMTPEPGPATTGSTPQPAAPRPTAAQPPASLAPPAPHNGRPAAPPPMQLAPVDRRP